MKLAEHFLKPFKIEDNKRSGKKLISYIEKRKKTVKNAEEIMELIYSFINKSPYQYGRTIDSMWYIIHQIEEEYEEEGTFTKDDLEENKEIFLEDFLIEDCNLYYKDYFWKLWEVVSSKSPFSYEEEKIGVFLLNQIIEELYWEQNSYLFEKKYQIYFEQKEKKTIIEDFIYMYFQIKGIDYKDSILITGFYCYLIKYKLIENKRHDFYYGYYQIKDMIFEEAEEIRIHQFENFLRTKENFHYYTIKEIDLMSGNEFEEFIAVMFRYMGYSTKITKASGDQGIDVLAKKGSLVLGIQAKCYSGAVGNSAIQEAHAGIFYYHCNQGIVITNSYFTKSAVELAKATKIYLWDRDELGVKLEALQIPFL